MPAHAQVLAALRGAPAESGLQPDLRVPDLPGVLLGEVPLVLRGHLGSDRRAFVLRVQLGLKKWMASIVWTDTVMNETVKKLHPALTQSQLIVKAH